MFGSYTGELLTQDDKIQWLLFCKNSLTQISFLKLTGAKKNPAKRNGRMRKI